MKLPLEDKMMVRGALWLRLWFVFVAIICVLSFFYRRAESDSIERLRVQFLRAFGMRLLRFEFEFSLCF